ncbi:hypothetical protein PR048_018383 [Dryococelus australis]|uniref:Uncharacterized protein n=1 Tax=Dryococelus australis TaxID=614101 RepID=A0ABQ9HC40_9NEOP|nr:hypothetical protein PR048_018383 [Dryococelus australis]
MTIRGAFVPDLARYINKCVKVLKVLCWVHKLDLVGNVWCSELTTLNECAVKAKMVFLNTRKRKHYYLEFQENPIET